MRTRSELSQKVNELIPYINFIGGNGLLALSIFSLARVLMDSPSSILLVALVVGGLGYGTYLVIDNRKHLPWRRHK